MPITLDQIRNIIKSKDDVSVRDLLALAELIEAGLPASSPAAVHSRVSRFAGQSIPHNVVTPIAWTAIEGDDDGFVNLGSDDEALMTVPAAYNNRIAMFSASVHWASSAAGTFRMAEIFSSSPVFTDYSAQNQLQMVASTVSPRQILAAGPIRLVTGQKLGVRVQHDVGVAHNMSFAVAACAFL